MSSLGSRTITLYRAAQVGLAVLSVSCFLAYNVGFGAGEVTGAAYLANASSEKLEAFFECWEDPDPATTAAQCYGPIGYR